MYAYICIYLCMHIHIPVHIPPQNEFQKVATRGGPFEACSNLLLESVTSFLNPFLSLLSKTGCTVNFCAFNA